MAEPEPADVGPAKDPPGQSNKQWAKGLAVPRAAAEAVRQVLVADGLLERGLAPEADGPRIVFPLVEGADGQALGAVIAAHEGAESIVLMFDRRTPRSLARYQDLLADLPDAAKEALPGSFDIVGDIAVIKIPPELDRYERRIGGALLQSRTNVNVVARDAGVQGTLRVRELSVIAGDERLVTTHREHGLALDVDLASVYFSPRLATERARVAARIQPGQSVVDMFAGLGALVCLVARDRAPVHITAIDINERAVALLERNLEHNGLHDAPVTVLRDDARTATPDGADADHVVMNLPHGADAFLGTAVACVADDGEIHIYGMVAKREGRDHGDALTERVNEAMRATGRPARWHLADVRHVRNYAPTLDGLAFTLRGASRGTVK